MKVVTITMLLLTLTPFLFIKKLEWFHIFLYINYNKTNVMQK